MADISKPEDKAANFGLIGAAFGIGIVLGPLMGGFLAEFGTRAPFYAAALLGLVNTAFAYFAVPETVTDRIRRRFEWRRANPFGAFKHIGSLPGFGPLMAITFLYDIAFFVFPVIWTYFCHAKFGWSPAMIGVSLAMFGISIALVQGVLLRPLLKRIGEHNTVLLALSINILAYVSFAFVNNGTLAVLLTTLTAFGSMAGPAMQGIMSRIASDDQQGELQGALTCINAVAMIVSPLLMTQIFWYFTSIAAPFYLPGAPFLASLLLTLIAISVFITYRPKTVPV